MFLTQNREFLELLKSLSYISRIQNIDYENNFTVLCTSERGQMTKSDKVPINKNCKFEGGGGCNPANPTCINITFVK